MCISKLLRDAWFEMQRNSSAARTGFNTLSRVLLMISAVPPESSRYIITISSALMERRRNNLKTLPLNSPRPTLVVYICSAERDKNK